MARNPFRSEGEMFRFLGVVIVGAVLVALGAWINVWVGVVVALLAVAGIVWWLMQEPVPGADTPAPRLESATPSGVHRVLLIVAPGASAPTVPDEATEVVVVVPALASKTEALTGAVDDRRAEAEQTALSLTRSLSQDGRSVRGEVGADDPVLAVEDALRTFGADEVVVAGDDAMVESIRARVAVPVRRA
jgi:flagellar basal body-associated protein FliL